MMGNLIVFGLAGFIFFKQDDVALACKNPKYAWGLTLVSVGAIIYSAYSYLNTL